MALTCEKHSAYLFDRGGRRKLASLDDLQRVKWGRKRDDPSTAMVFVGSPGIECQKALELAETNRVELVIFRGADRVWRFVHGIVHRPAEIPDRDDRATLVGRQHQERIVEAGPARRHYAPTRVHRAACHRSPGTSAAPSAGRSVSSDARCRSTRAG